MVIELANRCSLACVHCAVADTSHPHFDSTGYLDVEMAEGLFADLVESGISFDTLILFWLGDPLIHPEFSRIWAAAIRASAEHGVFGKVEVHTNATHLTKRNAAALLNEASSPQVIHFSLDATDRDRYHTIKGRDRYERVVGNIEHFLAEKARLGAPWPRPVFQFIVGSNNVDQVAPFRRYWERVCGDLGIPVTMAAGHVPQGDEAVVFFRQLDCPTAELQQRENAIFRAAMAAEGLQLPDQAQAGADVLNDNVAVCAGFWKSPVIGWDGSVTTCTRDSHMHNRVGGLREARFSELWWSETMRRRRVAVAKGDYSGLSQCQSCFIPKSLNYTAISEEEIDQWRVGV